MQQKARQPARFGWLTPGKWLKINQKKVQQKNAAEVYSAAIRPWKCAETNRIR